MPFEELKMGRYLVGAAAAAACALGSGAASAAVVTVSVGGVVVAGWEQSLDPTPIGSSLDYYTTVPVYHSFGLNGDTAVTWYNTVDFGGFTDYSELFNVLGPQAFNGPQSYGTPETAPVFLLGTYQGINDDQNDTLTTFVISVPEPASWATMLLGLGMIGLAARRPRKVAVSYS